MENKKNELRKKMEKESWLKDFFTSGFYERYWGWKFTEEDTGKLAEDCLKILNISKGHILDWQGGWGRVSVHFAKKRFEVTILDFVPEYLDKAKEIFGKENLKVNLVLADRRRTPSDIQADYATCLFNSVGFFNDKEQIRAFKSLHRALKSNGKVIVDCMNLFHLVNWVKPTNETEREDGYIFRQNNDFDFSTNTLHSQFEIINDKGEIEERKEFHQRLYTPMELQNTLELSGFKVEAMYGNYDQEKISFETPKILAVISK